MPRQLQWLMLDKSVSFHLVSSIDSDYKLQQMLRLPVADQKYYPRLDFEEAFTSYKEIEDRVISLCARTPFCMSWSNAVVSVYLRRCYARTRVFHNPRRMLTTASEAFSLPNSSFIFSDGHTDNVEHADSIVGSQRRKAHQQPRARAASSRLNERSAVMHAQEGDVLSLPVALALLRETGKKLGPFREFRLLRVRSLSVYDCKI